MDIVITYDLVLDNVVMPGDEVFQGIPLFAGQQLLVEPVYDEDKDCDWLTLVDGGVFPFPPDAWKPC